MKLFVLMVIVNLFFCGLNSGISGSAYTRINHPGYTDDYGAIRRGDTSSKQMAIVFTADEFLEGTGSILQTLEQNKIKASFFLTGNAYRDPLALQSIKKIKEDGHYLGAHSDKHLLYADWNKRDSTLITEKEFKKDLLDNYSEMKKFGIGKKHARFFLPPYEWYNSDIALWTEKLGLKLVNFTPGTRSNADYTYPEMGERYVSSAEIYNSIIKHERKDPNGLNGFILLLHAGAGPKRSDKFYDKLPELVKYLKEKKYKLVRIDKLLD